MKTKHYVLVTLGYKDNNGSNQIKIPMTKREAYRAMKDFKAAYADVKRWREYFTQVEGGKVVV